MGSKRKKRHGGDRAQPSPRDRIPLQRLDASRWEVPVHGAMRVPGRVYADAALVETMVRDDALRQVVNVAQLPGIVGASLGMPDLHSGYGFAIGGVAATDPQADGVVSPGGVGYDINCGVRLARTDLLHDEIRERVPELVQQLYARVPCGLGVKGGIGKVGKGDLRRVLRDGAAWAVSQGLGEDADLENTEERGATTGARPEEVSDRALERGLEQLGSLGSGNHFLELQVVDEVLLPEEAERIGLRPGGVTVMIHSGSRGLGHQVCSDALREMGQATLRYGIELPDRQLAAVPVRSPEGERYLGAMFAAANFAWCNRQVLMHLAAEALGQALGTSRAGLGFELVYDVAHNIAKLERHRVGDGERELLVHRKGATRAAVPAGSPLSSLYREIGQPVLIPGDMGRCSYVCLGTERARDETFGSTCHGAGRLMSRAEAKRRARGRDLYAELRARGVDIMAHGKATVAEEMPDAYKDVAQVVRVMERAGIVRPLARLRPVGVVKG